eukprot:TRINITY_DN3085_c0_g1_i2.p1 TRINITY_DN3085_c0_g1~~TRINITY_DN3085_c0_g1_i2.p1  ORF type:complete len:128 (-),score=9.51 TRINITY_DN3085_c0_g1_i2:131-514(-)
MASRNHFGSSSCAKRVFIVGTFLPTAAVVGDPVIAMAESTQAHCTGLLARSTPFAMLANAKARRRGLPVPFAANAVARADIGWPWRMDWGGHDPASPIAEMHINYHSTGWAIMIFVCTTTMYIMCKR